MNSRVPSANAVVFVSAAQFSRSAESLKEYILLEDALVNSGTILQPSNLTYMGGCANSNSVTPGTVAGQFFAMARI
jgi:hypothetical protein